MTLYVATGCAEKKIYEVAPGFARLTVERRAEAEIAIGDVRQVLFELVEVILTAEFYGVGTNYLTEVVGYRIDIGDQLVRTAGHADDEVVEVNLRNPLDAGCARKNAGLPVGSRANPRSESDFEVPPSGRLNLVFSRKYPRRNSFTAAELRVFTSLSWIVWVWPLLSTPNPG